MSTYATQSDMFKARGNKLWSLAQQHDDGKGNNNNTQYRSYYHRSQEQYAKAKEYAGKTWEDLKTSYQ